MKKTDNGKIQYESISELPTMAYSSGNMLQNPTGNWKFAAPIYREHLAPCRGACPAGNQIAAILMYLAQGDVETAWQTFLRTNPFPAITGRVCPHFCEGECNYQNLGDSLNIRGLERYIGDEGFAFKDPAKASRGKKAKVGIIGSGPAGLACAYYLALEGHAVDVYEAYDRPGGMLRVGIPDYRLPPAVLDKEIERLERLGIRFHCGQKINKTQFKALEKKYDAMFVAVGMHKARDMGIKGDSLKGVFVGLDILRQINDGKKPRLGKHIAVIGGGNTAMDVARSLVRQGKKVTVVYRRTRKEMPAIVEEVGEAMEEGIAFKFLAAPREIKGDKTGKVTMLVCQKMKLGAKDKSGRRKPVAVPRSTFNLKVDAVVTALGEDIDDAFLPAAFVKKAKTAGDPRTGLIASGKIFAGGDGVSRNGTVVHAISAGREASRAIVHHLETKKKDYYGTMALPLPEGLDPVRINHLNLSYFGRAERHSGHVVPARIRSRNFDEVSQGMPSEIALHESQRCFQCGTCNACGNCYTFCPDAAVHPKMVDGRKVFVIDLEHCKGCGICVTECPRSAMELQEVKK